MPLFLAPTWGHRQRLEVNVLGKIVKQFAMKFKGLRYLRVPSVRSVWEVTESGVSEAPVM